MTHARQKLSHVQCRLIAFAKRAVSSMARLPNPPTSCSVMKAVICGEDVVTAGSSEPESSVYTSVSVGDIPRRRPSNTVTIVNRSVQRIWALDLEQGKRAGEQNHLGVVCNAVEGRRQSPSDSTKPFMHAGCTGDSPNDSIPRTQSKLRTLHI